MNDNKVKHLEMIRRGGMDFGPTPGFKGAGATEVHYGKVP